MTVHERVWERTPEKPWRPLATYWLLGTMLAVFILQNLVEPRSLRLYVDLFIITPDWGARPWTPFTSTFAHGDFFHIFFNGLMLYFFGPLLERILGRREFVILFIASGAIAGILQVFLVDALYGRYSGALGASGAIMMVFGTLAILMPKQKLFLMFPPIPIPFWVAAVGYALLDVLGTFNASSGIGNIAHLSGMAIGVVFGLRLRQVRRRRFLASSPWLQR